MKKENYIKSPLNYTGGKFKILEQIMPLFPKNINIFYDVFCGGANVAINVNAEKIIGIDTNYKVMSLFNYFKKNNLNNIEKQIQEIIKYYKLSDSKVNGYQFYSCESSSGLGSYNKVFFNNLKKDYNSNKLNNFDKDLLFYMLIVYGFNNQIRFNKKNEYNMPVGKRDFNKSIQNNLINFSDKLKNIEIDFLNGNYDSIFEDIILKDGNNKFVYADPPYLITTATYNESGGWDENKEVELLMFLNNLSKNSVNFALSNVIEHKGQENKLLKNWITENKYNMHVLNHSYNNSSYHLKDKNTITKEVLITNY